MRAPLTFLTVLSSLALAAAAENLVGREVTAATVKKRVQDTLDACKEAQGCKIDEKGLEECHKLVLKCKINANVIKYEALTAEAMANEAESNAHTEERFDQTTAGYELVINPDNWMISKLADGMVGWDVAHPASDTKKIKETGRELQKQWAENSGVVVGLFGQYDAGKTHILEKLIERNNLGKGIGIETKGISGVQDRSGKTGSTTRLYFDSAGAKRAVAKNSLTERIVTDQFTENMLLSLCDINILVTNTLTTDVQQKINEIADEFVANNRGIDKHNEDIRRKHEQCEKDEDDGKRQCGLWKLRNQQKPNDDGTPNPNGKFERLADPKLWPRTPKKLYIIHNLKNIGDHRGVDKHIDHDIVYPFKAQFEEHPTLKDSRGNRAHYWFERKTAKDYVIHLIYAKESTPAGDFYNENTLQFIKRDLDTAIVSNPKKIHIAEQLERATTDTLSTFLQPFHNAYDERDTLHSAAMGQVPRGPVRILVDTMDQSSICLGEKVVTLSSKGFIKSFPNYPETTMADTAHAYFKAEVEADKMSVYGATAAVEGKTKKQFPQSKPFYDSSKVSNDDRIVWSMNYHEFPGKEQRFVPDTTILENLKEFVILVDLPGMPDEAFYDDKDCGRDQPISGFGLVTKIEPGVCFKFAHDKVLALDGMRSIPEEMADKIKYVDVMNMQTANRFEPFRMQIQLPTVVDHTKVEWIKEHTTLKNGVLTFKIPREKQWTEENCRQEL